MRLIDTEYVIAMAEEGEQRIEKYRYFWTVCQWQTVKVAVQ